MLYLRKKNPLFLIDQAIYDNHHVLKRHNSIVKALVTSVFTSTHKKNVLYLVPIWQWSNEQRSHFSETTSVFTIMVIPQGLGISAQRMQIPTHTPSFWTYGDVETKESGTNTSTEAHVR